MRRVDSHRRPGRFNIPSVGVYVWRLLSLSVTDTPACCVEDIGPHCFTFSVLGHDAPLFVAPQRETDPTSIADELNLPAAIRRAPFDAAPGRYYGDGLSLVIRTEGWAGAADGVVPLAAIMPSDLSGWHYRPPAGRMAGFCRGCALPDPIGLLPGRHASHLGWRGIRSRGHRHAHA